MADFEDALSPTWDNLLEGQRQPDRRRRAARSPSSSADGRVYRLNERDRHPARPPPRLAPAREARPRRRRPDLGQPVRLRPLLLPQRQAPARAGQRALLLPAQAGEPPRGAPLERRLRLGPGPARHPARHDQGHRADRDHPRRLRDGRDPLRAARPLAPGSTPAAGTTSSASSRSSATDPDFAPARPRPGDDDRALHARLHRAAGQDLPPPRRPRHRRHGRVHPQPRATRRSTRPALAKVREDKQREAGDGFDGTWVAHPDLVPVATEVFDAVLGERPNQVERQRDGGPASAGASCSTSPCPAATVTEAGVRNNVSVGIQYLESWLRGDGAAGDLQPDGGRRHRRDLPLPDLAVAPQRRHAGRAASRSPATSSGVC